MGGNYSSKQRYRKRVVKKVMKEKIERCRKVTGMPSMNSALNGKLPT